MSILEQRVKERFPIVTEIVLEIGDETPFIDAEAGSLDVAVEPAKRLLDVDIELLYQAPDPKRFMSWMLILYCLLIIGASLAGGWIPSAIRLGHRRTQMILSLVSGVMLGVALLHLLPHAISVLDDIDVAMAATLTGLLFMFFMIRMFHFHQHHNA